MAFLVCTLGAGCILSGCATTTQVDYDQEALTEIRAYQCFAIDTREARTNYQDVVLSPIVDRRIERTISEALLAKGFTNTCDNPDFRVTFNTTTKTKTRINDLSLGPIPYRRSPYHYYRYDRYSRIQIDQYEEGTFIIDIIDHASKELVWRGAYRKRLGWSAPSDEDIKEIVYSILAEFPPNAVTKP